MHNVLIYSPSFDGHRQVFLFVFVNVLKELGFKIFIAGNTMQIYSNSYYIEKLKKSPGIEIVDTSKYSNGGIDISPAEFLELQNFCETDFK